MSETTAKPNIYCCLTMDKMIGEGYLFPTITLNFGTNDSSLKVLPPHIQGPMLTERGRKRRPSMLVNYCPWCGVKLAKDGN